MSKYFADNNVKAKMTGITNEVLFIFPTLRRFIDWEFYRFDIESGSILVRKVISPSLSIVYFFLVINSIYSHAYKHTFRVLSMAVVLD
jgi:hypothetical protein